MITCSINGRARTLESVPETWGELLARLEQGSGPDRAIVSAVRFQGVERPSFRDAALAGQRLAALAPIAVDVTTAGELIAEAAQTVRDGLQPLALAARATADAFRRHDLVPAHRGLAEFIGTLRALTQLTAAIETIAHPAACDADAAAPLRRLQESLERLITAASDEDWISVADALEFEIAEAVPEWGALLGDVGRGEAAARRVS